MKDILIDYTIKINETYNLNWSLKIIDDIVDNFLAKYEKLATNNKKMDFE